MIQCYFVLNTGHMCTQNGQSPSSQGCGQTQGRVCFNMSTWKNLGGNFTDSAADVSPCLHAWNWGWALWSKWKRTAEVCSPGEFELRAAEQVRKCFHLRIFPDSPAKSTVCDHRPLNTAGWCLASSLSWLRLKPFGIPGAQTAPMPNANCNTDRIQVWCICCILMVINDTRNHQHM